ncbi:mucin-17 isoform X2 [Ooceraea biroi]|nr:mucin-17 isoform X2 [Ooceraea biroi]XP_019885911.2 mucin-17 isoform X2 [Ooceraea biroi]
MSGQSGGHRTHLAKLNDQLTCKLCGGYFIDATTIIECLHSFCRSCIVKYLEANKYCPICDVQVHKSRPLLNIRPDHTLQDIVYKLVPGCYQNEMRCRREFYAKHPEVCSQVMSPEARGEPIESHIYSPDESLSLSLEYFNPHAKDLNETDVIEDDKSLLRRYLRCPAAVTVFHLQKLIRAKHGLSDAHRVDIMYKEEPLCSSYTLMDVMYIYHWRRKVPLHLSYRIFESSLKRIKLSEDNANYTKSLTNADIESMELKDEKSLKREWKEVQLKISETGVMSITDISNTVHKRDAEIENRDEKTSKETITSYIAVDKTDSLVEKCGISKSAETVQSILAVIDTKSPMFPDTSDASVVKSENASKCCASLIAQQNGSTTTKQTNEMGNCVAPTKSQQDTREVKGNNQTIATVEDKSLLQKTIIGQPAMQLVEQNVPVVENADGTNAKKLSINNNNTDFRAETQREGAKGTSEAKAGPNAGSKIDALSAKLQFQPKMGQVNNTYSKKVPKEKRAILQATRRLDAKSASTDAPKTRMNCGGATDKVSVSCSTAAAPSQKPVVSAAPQDIPVTVSSSKSGGQPALYETGSQGMGIDVQQALNLLEQRTSSPASQTSADSGTPRTSHVTDTTNQRSQSMQSGSKTTPSESVASSVPNVSTSTVSQTTSTFSYTVHDLVTTSAALKATLKSAGGSDGGGVLEKSLGTPSPVACSTSGSQMPSFGVQTSSMSVYSIPTSLKNNSASQGVTTVTAASAATSKPTTSTSTSTGTCPVPPCPDAIPISLMKQASMRKQEATAKGTNLNEICAKIGSNTSGSKINDICAKIGENSKEKNRVEVRKSDVPDLLKISTKKSSSPSFGNSDTTMKHIPNIPNVPVYTPSGNAMTMESKGAKLSLPSSTSTGSLAVSTSSALTTHVTQRMSALKKQSQPMGYKTLRDPPKSWNPTLSKNNYVAVKNQARETQITSSEGTSEQIPSKPAKIFKMRNMPRYLGNPASGVKPMYGVANDAKEKEQSTTNTKSATLNMMKIDPKTLSPIVSTVNSPIVSPPPYSPNARSYQNTPYSRDICRNTGSPISPRNSPVNMLSTNPFIPSPTPNTNPRIIYSHFPPPFPDASRFPNPLIRSPIGIPPPSAFHSSLPPSINKLYQRSSYIPQTTGYSPVSSQPPAVQRIPPSTHSSSPKSPKTSSPSSISSTSFNLGKTEPQSSPITSTVDSVALLLSKSVPVPVPVTVPISLPVSSQRELNAFNLSKTGNSTQAATCSVTNSDVTAATVGSAATTSAKATENSGGPSTTNERKHCKEAEAQKVQEAARSREESSTAKLPEAKCDAVDNVASSASDKKEKTKVNGDVTAEQFTNKKSKEGSDETLASAETAERDDQAERSPSKERNGISKSNQAQSGVKDLAASESVKNEDLGKTTGEQIQGKRTEAQKNKAET